MKTRTLLIATAAASIFACAGFANAAEDADDQGPADEQGTQDQQNGPAPDQSMSDQEYNQHWFSPTGYGPHDEQAGQTRALNNEQLQNGGEVDRGRDNDDDMQGPSDEATPPDADDDDQDDQAPRPDYH